MNKTLFKSIREYKKQSLLAPLLVILEVLMEVLIPLEMAKIIDVGIANGDLGLYHTTGSDPGSYGNACALFWCTGRKYGSGGICRICQRISVMISFIRCRIFHSKTLIIFPHQDWSHE